MAENKSEDRIELFKVCILYGLCYMLIVLVFGGKIKMYINPHYTWLTIFAIIVIFLMAMVQTRKVLQSLSESHKHDHHRSSVWSLFPFLVPLVFAFMLPNSTLSADLASKRGIDIGSSSTAATSPITNSPSSQNSNYPTSPSNLGGADKDHDYSLDNTLTLTDDNFVNILNQIYAAPQKFNGKEISMTGFVARDSDFSKTQFGLVRYVIVCCTADAMPGGFLCELEHADSYKDGTWLQIKGTLGMDKFRGMDTVVARINSLQTVKAPDSPYVYPY